MDGWIGVRVVRYAIGEKRFFSCTDATFGQKTSVNIFTLPEEIMSPNFDFSGQSSSFLRCCSFFCLFVVSRFLSHFLDSMYKVCGCMILSSCRIVRKAGYDSSDIRLGEKSNDL